MKRARLGTTTDNSVAWNWNTSNNAWQEIGGGNWRVSRVGVDGQGHDIFADVHARSGDGAARGRLGNKLRIVRLATTGVTRRENLHIFSEDLAESYFNGSWIRFKDGSRGLYAFDESPVVGVENFYAVEMLSIPDLNNAVVHSEVSEGSTLKIDPYEL